MLIIYLIIKPRTKQDSYVPTMLRLTQNRDPKKHTFENLNLTLRLDVTIWK